MTDRCPHCGASLGTTSGSRKPCVKCDTQQRVRWMLNALPAEDDPEFGEMTDWEQEFVASVRQQLERGRTLSEKQYEIIDRIYGKVR